LIFLPSGKHSDPPLPRVGEIIVREAGEIFIARAEGIKKIAQEILAISAPVT